MSIQDFNEEFKRQLTASEDVDKFSSVIELGKSEDDFDRLDGSFEYKGKKFTFMGFEGVTASFISVSYSVVLKTKRIKLVDIYKSANRANSRLPGIKLVVDKTAGEVIYTTCNLELVQHDPIRDFHFIFSMLDILTTAHKYFQNELDGE